MVNEWTAGDLPKVFDDSRCPGILWNPSPDLMRDLAGWLNEHHPKPEPFDRGAASFDLFTVRDQLKQSRGERAEIACARDAAVARAETAERERDEWRERADEMARLLVEIGELEKVRPVGTVTRDEVEKAIKSGMSGLVATIGQQCVTEAVAAVWALLQPEPVPDPVEQLSVDIETAAYEAMQSAADLLSTTFGLDVAVDDLLPAEWTREWSRSIARHVVDQERQGGESDA